MSTHSNQPALMLISALIFSGTIKPLAAFGLEQVIGREVNQFPGSSSAPQATPTSPPYLAPRPPIPRPEPIAAPGPKPGNVKKEPLSWRAKTQLHPPATSTQPAATRKVTGELTRTFKAGIDDTFLAVVAACPMAGFTLNEVNSAAGTLAAGIENSAHHDAKVQINLEERVPGQTTVHLALHGPQIDRQLLQPKILDLVEASLESKLTHLGKH